MPFAPQVLSSSSNPLLKEIRRAASRGSLTEQGYAVAEGAHLLDEAIESGIEIAAILTSDEIDGEEYDWPPQAAIYQLPKALFREVATTDSPQGFITLVRPRECHIGELFSSSSTTLLLDGIQDPGNAGAIVRAAEAFAATGVVFLKSTVSPFNPKCLRASAGSLFRLPYLNHPDPEPVRAAIAEHGILLYAAMPEAELRIDQVDWSRPSAVVVGSEGRGVSELWSAGATPISIPTTGVESLNAATAAAVILYEARKRVAAVQLTPTSTW